uniref:Uncharacterized protein n=1 Tax=Solanum tuberosum TaxID=4113 RepID=M1DJJ3_SOLTU
MRRTRASISSGRREVVPEAIVETPTRGRGRARARGRAHGVEPVRVCDHGAAPATCRAKKAYPKEKTERCGLIHASMPAVENGSQPENLMVLAEDLSVLIQLLQLGIQCFRPGVEAEFSPVEVVALHVEVFMFHRVVVEVLLKLQVAVSASVMIFQGGLRSILLMM